MAVSSNYQFLQAAAFGELERMKLLVEQMPTNNLCIEAADTDGSVLRAASDRFDHAAIRYQVRAMNALHLSCLMGHENVIQYLIKHFPKLLHGKAENDETPFLTLTRTIGAVRIVSDQCFEFILSSISPLDSFCNKDINALHQLTFPKCESKLRLYLNFFMISREEITEKLSSQLPITLINIILDYGNFYSKAIIENRLNQKDYLNLTPMGHANLFGNHEARALLLKAGAQDESPSEKLLVKRESYCSQLGTWFSKMINKF